MLTYRVVTRGVDYVNRLHVQRKHVLPSKDAHKKQLRACLGCSARKQCSYDVTRGVQMFKYLRFLYEGQSAQSTWQTLCYLNVLRAIAAKQRAL
jgi:hypothetical protein